MKSVECKRSVGEVLRGFFCFFFGHRPVMSYWSVPSTFYRCGRCKKSVPMEE